MHFTASVHYVLVVIAIFYDFNRQISFRITNAMICHLFAHGPARQDDENLFDLFGTHRRIDSAQKELQQARTADLNEWYELMNLGRSFLLSHVTQYVRHPRVVVLHV